MLARIKNSISIKSRKVEIIRTKLTEEICKILKKEGFIEKYEESGKVYITEKGYVHKNIIITLKYKGIKQKSYISGLNTVSKPGIRIYVNKKNIPRILGGIGIAFLSTSKGILTDREARDQKIGGEILFYIW